MAKKLVQCASLGVWCGEEAARSADEAYKSLPKDDVFRYRRKAVVTKGDVVDGERADVSYITTEDTDREREKVVASGIRLEDYRLNPVVLYDHDYAKIIGHNLWIKQDGRGLVAKTLYAARPEEHVGEWFPDTVYALVRQNVLRGKSIGFLPLNVRMPTAEEKSADGGLEVVIDEALLLEYSCVTVPCNPTALVQAVSKGMKLPFTVMSVGRVQKRQAPQLPRRSHYTDVAKQLEGVTFDPDEILRLALAQITGRV